MMVEMLIWLASLMVYNYEDMKEEIDKFNILSLVMRCSDSSLTPSINMRSAQCISILSLYDDFFESMVNHNVIELSLNMCLDNSQDIKIQEHASNAIVNFSLNKKWFQILINKNVMDLFDAFG